MIKYLMLLVVLLKTSSVNADHGTEWWKNCPGPACPSRDYNSEEAGDSANLKIIPNDPSNERQDNNTNHSNPEHMDNSHRAIPPTLHEEKFYNGSGKD